MSNVDPGSSYNVMKVPPANYRLPETLFCDEENMDRGERTGASTVAAATPQDLSNVYRSTENKNLLSDQLTQQY